MLSRGAALTAGRPSTDPGAPPQGHRLQAGHASRLPAPRRLLVCGRPLARRGRQPHHYEDRRPRAPDTWGTPSVRHGDGRLSPRVPSSSQASPHLPGWSPSRKDHSRGAMTSASKSRRNRRRAAFPAASRADSESSSSSMMTAALAGSSSGRDPRLRAVVAEFGDGPDGGGQDRQAHGHGLDDCERRRLGVQHVRVGLVAGKEVAQVGAEAAEADLPLQAQRARQSDQFPRSGPSP